ncbi:MAG: ATP-binding protein [Clostridia bacterium]|nr:ATP-binding protein [Clostridia bacterium]
MGKIIAVCGKLCGGKTYYSNRLREKGDAVLLSCDEILETVFHKELGDRHDETVLDIKRYLLAKALEITAAGCDVILDWGFWKESERRSTAQFFKERDTVCEWHYIDIADDDHRRNIEERNKKVLEGKSPDYYVDDGLLEKFRSLFEVPEKDEIDVWHSFVRE